MKCLSVVLVASIALLAAVPANANDELCAPLQAFVKSIKPGETKQLEFHTSWLRGFKDDPNPRIMMEKRCIDHGYAPAKAVCAYLMKDGQVEFAGNNAKRALMCLSPRTTFAPLVQLDLADFSFSYGTEQRGSNVTLTYSGDDKIGGMVLTINADGY